MDRAIRLIDSGKYEQTNKKGLCTECAKPFFMVPRDRIELPTRGFSVPCSTD